MLYLLGRGPRGYGSWERRVQSVHLSSRRGAWNAHGRDAHQRVTGERVRRVEGGGQVAARKQLHLVSVERVGLSAGRHLAPGPPCDIGLPHCVTRSKRNLPSLFLHPKPPSPPPPCKKIKIKIKNVQRDEKRLEKRCNDATEGGNRTPRSSGWFTGGAALRFCLKEFSPPLYIFS